MTQLSSTITNPSLKAWHTYVIGAQMLFVAFGALVLIPIITGLDPSIALFTAGLGTIVFTFITKGKVPVFLASSFAFVAPIQQSLAQFGYGATFCGMASVGIVYAILSAVILWRGINAVQKVLPAIVTGPVIMVIGLGLTPIASDMAVSFDSSGVFNGQAAILSAVTAGVAIAIALSKRRLLNLLPIIIAAGVGYFISIAFGVVDYTAVVEAPWIQLPWTSASEAGRFEMPVWSIGAILIFLPVAIVPAVEHVGDVLAIQSVTKQNYLENPGLHRTILGDGIATALAGLFGGPPNTTYSEVTGAVALTKAFSVTYMRIGAIVSILLAFSGKLSALLGTVPVPVMGGVMVIVFGMIAAVGLNTIVRAKVDFEDPKNYIVFAVIMVVGVGKLTWTFGGIELGGVGLAAILGIILNQILPSRPAAAADEK
ncbi:uracil-xanthine permease family protein [Pelagicoccus albus]|uniref:Uracil permease n=1 Tax=Pelagicoccus albus TaxID=415222 RepID=A0A7X1B903_9BACT|nr:solute carrier family 23 protein [Pelagicoccus albus]MBC2607917.1 uracil permease [Pelagicoccus albus]